MKISPVGAELSHAHRQTDGQRDVIKLRVAFRKFVKGPKNSGKLKCSHLQMKGVMTRPLVCIGRTGYSELLDTVQWRLRNFHVRRGINPLPDRMYSFKHVTIGKVQKPIRPLCTRPVRDNYVQYILFQKRRSGKMLQANRWVTSHSAPVLFISFYLYLYSVIHYKMPSVNCKHIVLPLFPDVSSSKLLDLY
jgi:hypothetical protein